MAETPKVQRWYKRSRSWRRLGINASAFSVGSTAAALSWQHIVHTVTTYGHQGALAGYLYPVSIDGMMIVGVVKAADNRSEGRRVGFWPRVCTWLGGMQSIAAQILSAWPYGWVARAIAVVPSSSLIIVVETMSRRSKTDPRVIEAQAQAARDQEVSVTPVDASIASTAPVPPAEVPTAVTEPSGPIVEAVLIEDEPAAVEDMETVAKPRRKPSRRGYPGTGADDATIDAARLALTVAKANGHRDATGALFVEPVDSSS